jgi:hypothetical protein
MRAKMGRLHTAFAETDTETGTTRYNTVGTAALSVRYNTVQ